MKMAKSAILVSFFNSTAIFTLELINLRRTPVLQEFLAHDVTQMQVVSDTLSYEQVSCGTMNQHHLVIQGYVDPYLHYFDPPF